MIARFYGIDGDLLSPDVLIEGFAAPPARLRVLGCATFSQRLYRLVRNQAPYVYREIASV